MKNEPESTEDEFESQPVKQEEQLSIDQLVEKALELELVITTYEDALKEAEKEYRNIIEKELVQAVLSTGFKSGETADGKCKIRIASNLYVTEVKDYNKRRELMRKRAEWLEQNDGVSMIRENIEVTFDKGEHERAQRVAQTLQKLGVPYEQSETINPASFKAFVNDLLTEGEEVPLDDLGLYQRTEAKITAVASSPRRRK